MISRRKFLQLGGLALPAVSGVDAYLIETTRLKVKEYSVRAEGTCRFVHFSDFHYRGDAGYAAEVIDTINKLEPEFVCFTGDLIEHRRFLPEALDFIRAIKAPVYGSPGNHDYWSGASFVDYHRAFAATGGGWLVDRSDVLPEHDFEIVGMAYVGIHAFRPPRATRRILLMHYPAMADHLGTPFDLILSGHSHGGQIRVPFFGPVLMPNGVGRYDLGPFPNTKRASLCQRRHRHARQLTLSVELSAGSYASHDLGRGAALRRPRTAQHAVRSAIGRVSSASLSSQSSALH